MLWEEVKLNLKQKKFIWASTKKILSKVTYSQVWYVKRFFEKMAKKLKETDGQADRLPKWFLVLHLATKIAERKKLANIKQGQGSTTTVVFALYSRI